jgi:hypothetical protein
VTREYNHIPEQFNVDAMFDESEYLFARDLKGRDVNMTISGCTPGLLVSEGNKKNRKPILTFEEHEKKLAINKTNKKVLVKLFGNDVRNWFGKRITAFPTVTNFGGEVKECIRIRPREAPPKGQQRQQQRPTEAPPQEPQREPGDET